MIRLRPKTKKALRYVGLCSLVGTLLLLSRDSGEDSPDDPVTVKHLQPPPEINNAGELLRSLQKRVPREEKQLQEEEKVEIVEEDGLRDWHDRAAMAADLQRVGPGEQGAAYRLSPDEETKKKSQELYRANGFNGLVSDAIALDRSVKDIRHPLCNQRRYAAKLPTVSVILPFHNEHLSTLLRSVQATINRSPPELLKEVILVDDASTKDFLKDELDKIVADKWSGKVRVVRAGKREGLIRARLLGVRAATAQVVVIFDSHSEPNPNWLPPLLEPIAKNRKTIVCPFVDVIDHDTFEYRSQDEGARGAFDWELYYKRLPLTKVPEKLFLG